MPNKPPVTPSPHRFLPVKKAKSGQTSKLETSSNAPTPANPESANETPRLQAPRYQQQQSAAEPSQFAATPRFSAGRPRTWSSVQRSPSPPKPSLAQALSRPRRVADDVEEPAEQDEDEEMVDPEHDDAVATIEHNDHLQHHPALPFSPKRRRLNGFTPERAIQESTFKRPYPPAAPSVPHFTSQRSTIPPESQHYNRPAFVRPSPAPSEPSEPLPETFSPHKRGQKFVPGGLASTVQQWVIETGEAAVQSRKGQGYLLGEEWISRVRIEEIGGAGPFTVKGMTSSGAAVAMLLAGAGPSADDGGRVFAAASVVGVKAPVWELEMEGRNWTVAVDWKILS